MKRGQRKRHQAFGLHRMITLQTCFFASVDGAKLRQQYGVSGEFYHVCRGFREFREFLDADDRNGNFRLRRSPLHVDSLSTTSVISYSLQVGGDTTSMHGLEDVAREESQIIKSRKSFRPVIIPRFCVGRQTSPFGLGQTRLMTSFAWGCLQAGDWMEKHNYTVKSWIFSFFPVSGFVCFHSLPRFLQLCAPHWNKMPPGAGTGSLRNQPTTRARWILPGHARLTLGS